MWKLAVVFVLAALVGVEGTFIDLVESCYKNQEGGVFRAPCINQTGVASTCQWSYNTEPSSCSVISFIVQRHNELRRYVALGSELRGVGGAQPRAANMEKLVWDEDLRKYAAAIAVDCINDPDTCNVSTDEDVDVGVSTFAAVSTADNISVAWRKAMDSWYNEVVKFRNTNIPIFASNAGTDNYTQMVWAETNTVGCVSAVYGEVTQVTPAVPQRRLMVCAYGPKGNIEGQSLYVKGAPCSGCLKNCFNGALCDFS